MRRPKQEMRTLVVTDSKRITPNMHRITLGGPDLARFPRGTRGGYIKLILSKPVAGKPLMRTYTVRRESADGMEVDFALHGGSDEDAGPATRWAVGAEIGAELMVGGPGPAKPLPAQSGPFLLIGDMTALPAISVNLEDLPADATGRAIVLIRDPADKQEIVKPDGVSIEWIVEADLGGNSALLADAVRCVPNLGAFSYVWAACEFEAMKLLRTYLRGEMGLGKDRLYISSYWKRGLVEDDHKQVKRADAEKTA